jgi:hypothetical protein
MSASDNAQEKIQKVLQAAIEPSYISEIARKLGDAFPDETWNVSNVAQSVSVLSNNDRVDLIDVGYQGADGQEIGSPHLAADPSVEGGTKEWATHTIVHWDDGDIDSVDNDTILDFVEPAVTVSQKANVIDRLSGEGNEISRQAEKIMQDELSRQFRNYDVVQTPGYNNPGLDFVVEDEEQRKYGLAVEISTRYENPVDGPYLGSKQDKALAEDYDLAILAPAFTEELREEYERVTYERWHKETEGEITHLHRVPTDKPEVYRPFATEPVDLGSDIEPGFPVIVSDGDRVRDKLRDTGHVSDNYPVVDRGGGDISDLLDGVERDYRVIPESGYRTQLRESLEPLLHEFSKPYRIEQWLIDTYWDQGLDSPEVAELTTVGERTIREWLSDRHWDIVTRGTGTPLTDGTREVWRRMYEGESPFPREMTGYEIQALYNEHPFFTLSDWQEWYGETTEQERADIMAQRQGPQDQVSYTILLGSDERLFPSYDFIIETIRPLVDEIREGFFGETGVVYPTATALEFMLNRNVERINVDDEPDQRDVTTMRSSLEVDLAEYLSEEEVPFGHEPFTVPSPFESAADSRTINDIIDETDGQDLLNTWRRIHNKHKFGQLEDMSPEETLAEVDREFIVPDFATYPDATMEMKGQDWIGWSDYRQLIEVSGAYGTPKINDLSSWYRFNSVAEKELAYKLLGIWDKVLFVLTDDEDIPEPVRNDSHYVIINPSQLESGMDRIGADLIK